MAPSKKSTKVESTTETPVVETPVKSETKKAVTKKSDAKSETPAPAAAPAPTKSASKKSDAKSETPAPAAAPAPTKSASKKSDAKTEAAAPAEAAAKAPRKSKQAEKKEETSAPVPVEAPSDEASSDPKARRVVSKESTDADCTRFAELIMSEIERLKSSEQKSPKTRGIKYLRTLHKTFRQLHKDINKVTKFKKNNSRKNNGSSGFLTPVKISEQMAKFLSWDVSNEYTRTQVTKEICNYVKVNNLNDPSNRRNINVDVKLKNLLGYDPSNPPRDEESREVLPLTYYRLQQYLAPHFISSKPPKEKKSKKVEAELDE
jgi:chromatin remodeling complex protein RSC6